MNVVSAKRVYVEVNVVSAKREYVEVYVDVALVWGTARLTKGTG